MQRITTTIPLPRNWPVKQNLAAAGYCLASPSGAMRVTGL